MPFNGVLYNKSGQALKKGEIQMITLYILTLIGSFLIGWWDGGDITYFVFMLLFAPAVIESKMEERKKVRKNDV